MIVETMTHEEVYRELAKEREGVSAWWRHQLDAMQHRVKTARKFPVYRWLEYTSPQKTRYLFFTRIFDKRMRTILTGSIVIRRTNEGMTTYSTWLTHQLLVAPMVMLPHMWRRYAERMRVDKSGAELVRHYFTHNAHGRDSNNRKAVARSVRYMDVEHLSCCVPEGVLLGQMEGNLFIVHTFITYDMCSGLQAEEFGSKRDQIKTDAEIYKEALFFYRHGIPF